jgi:DNA-binding CsgD family transcriptional regulator
LPVPPVPLQSSPSAIESTILVHPSGLLEGLSALFEALWQIALPLDIATKARGRTPPAHPSHDERRILSMLTAGLSDEAAARQLNMSDRTYQRRVRGLMETLDVQTRFQLARQAIRRGWLPSDRADSQDERREQHPSSGVATLTAVTNHRPDSTTPHIASIRP